MSYNKLACPVCNKSLYSEEALKPLWQFYDTEIKSMPMTTMYQVFVFLVSSVVLTQNGDMKRLRTIDFAYYLM